MGNLKKHKLLGTEGQYDRSVCGMLFPRDVAAFWADGRTPPQNVCARCREEHDRRKPPATMSPLGHLLGKEGGRMDMVILPFIVNHGRFPTVEDIQADLVGLAPKRIQGHLNHLKRKHSDFLEGLIR